MGRPERVIDPAGGPLQQFALALRQLRADAGGPSYREMSRRAFFSVTALSEAAGGKILPSLQVTLAYVEACGGDAEIWTKRWRALVRQLAGPGSASSDDAPVAPYLGLVTFQTADARFYFGRESLIRHLRARVAQDQFVSVFGASGSGKSSLLRAGLLPALAADTESTGHEWLTIVTTPGGHPVDEIVGRLADLAKMPADPLLQSLTADPRGVGDVIGRLLAGREPSTRVLLVVDQFEEVFTLCQEEGRRREFIDLVLVASATPRVCVVLGVRADFYGRCGAYPALVAALQDRQVLVGPMGADDLRCVVTEPARQAGLAVEPALVQLVVDEAGGEPGALPLLSHALRETWRQRRDKTLTAADYVAVGRVQGAVARTAEEVYATFEPAEQQVAREVLLRLTMVGDGTEDTRRRATPEELLNGQDTAVAAAVLGRLTAARLITYDTQTVTVVHEALIRGWPRLRGWLTEDRDRLRALRRLTEDAAEWDRQDRDGGLLYRRARLAQWEGRPLDGTTALEQEFLASSRRRLARDRAARRRRTRAALAGMGVAVTVMSLLAGIAWFQALRAESERDLALSRQLTAEALREIDFDPELALNLSRRAYATAPTREAEMMMRQAIASTGVRAVVSGRSPRVLGVQFSPAGDRLVSTGSDGVVRVWRWAGQHIVGEPTELVGHRGEAWSPVFSPDGRWLATAGIDGTVRIWDLTTNGGPTILHGHAGPVWSVAFSSDGRRVISGGDDATVRGWNIDGTGAATVLGNHDGPVTAVAFSPGGTDVASGGHDRTVRIWRASDPGRTVGQIKLPDIPKRLAFTGDGDGVSAALIDGTARVFPLAGGDPVVLHGHAGRVEALAHSADAWWIATGSDDTTVRVWSRDGGGDPLILRGHKRTVWSVAFSPDGSRLVSAGDDGVIRIWDPRGAGNPKMLRGHDGPVTVAVQHPDAVHVVSGGVDGTIRIWDAERGAEPLVLRGPRTPVYGVGISSDGDRVAGASADGVVRIWNIIDRDRLDPAVLRGHEGAVWEVAFSPDGRRLATAGSDGTVRIWDATGAAAPLVRRADEQYLRDLAFSPDGTRVATAGRDGNVRIWDVMGAAPPTVLRGHEGLVWSVAFSPDGRQLASAGDDGTVRIWSTTGGAAPQVLRGHLGFAWHVAFSADGRWVVSSGADNTVRIWQSMVPGRPVIFRGFGASTDGAAFGSPGDRLLTAHDDGTVRIWQCVPCGQIDQLLSS